MHSKYMLWTKHERRIVGYWKFFRCKFLAQDAVDIHIKTKKNEASFQLYKCTSTKQACQYRFLTIQYMYTCRTLPSSYQVAHTCTSKASTICLMNTDY